MAFDKTKPMRGMDGSVYLDAAEVGYIDSWTLNPSKDSIEVTKLGASSKEMIDTLTSATVSISGTMITGDPSQATLRSRFVKENDNAITSGDLLFKLYEYRGALGTDADSSYYEVTVAPTSISLETSAGDLAKFSFEGNVSGDIVHRFPTPSGD